MRSKELRDDGASLTTLEDLAPIFYGRAFDIVSFVFGRCAALRESLICLLASVQLSVAPEARLVSTALRAAS